MGNDNSGTGAQMEYFEHQARWILGITVAQEDPRSFREARETAAKQLIDDFLAMAERQGLKRRVNVQKDPVLTISEGAAISLKTDGGGNVYVVRHGNGPSPPATHVALSFDCVNNVLMGTEVDTNVAPTPGQALPLVHPFIAIARTVAALFANEGEQLEIEPYRRTW